MSFFNIVSKKSSFSRIDADVCCCPLGWGGGGGGGKGGGGGVKGVTGVSNNSGS